MVKYTLLVCVLCFTNELNAQPEFLDSLKSELKKSQHDSVKCKTLDLLIESEYDDAIWPKYNKQMLTLVNKNLKKQPTGKQKLFFLKYKARALTNQSLVYSMQGNVPLALESVKQSLKIQKELKDDVGIGVALNNIGGIYMDMNNFADALKYHIEALNIRLKIKDSLGMAQSYSNLGVIYNREKDKKKGLEYYRKALIIRMQLRDKFGATATLNNIGFVYRDLANAETNKELKDQYTDTALMYYSKNLEIEKSINNKRGICYSYHNIASIYLIKKDIAKAKSFEKEALKIAFELNYPEPIMHTTQQMSAIMEKEGNTTEAFKLYKVYIKMRDSLNSEEAKRAGIQNKLQYEYDKKATADSVKRVEEKKLMVAEKQSEKFQRFVLYGGLGLTFLFAMFMLNRFSLVRKQRNLILEQKQEVEMQKHMVDEKQKEILDSIHYAKRIQEALMPPAKSIEKTINEL